MIIPPDPEKDPNIYNASSSTTSLVLPPTDSDTDSVARPVPSHPASHPYGQVYDEWTGEQLPPYERRRAGSIRSVRTAMSSTLVPITEGDTSNRNSDSRLHRHQHSIPLHIPPTPNLPSGSSSSFPTIPSPTTTLNDPTSSRAKLFESSSSSSHLNKEDPSHRKRRRILPAAPPKVKRWWKRWKKWILGILVLVLIGLGLMTGLLVGLKQRDSAPPQPTESSYSPWHDIDERKTNTNWASDGSLNLTYVPTRDGPTQDEGQATLCNRFAPVNTSDFSQLATPYPAVTVQSTTFYFPLTKRNNWTGFTQDFFINARGLGSSGTVTFIGSESSDDLIKGGQEGQVRVDVVLSYGGPQDPQTIMQVCKMVKPDNSSGVGIYTPIQTDGKITNPYQLDPTQLPSFQVVIRLPPSAIYLLVPQPIYLPSLTLNLERMNVASGTLENSVQFGLWNVTTGRGGVTADYLDAKDVRLVASYNNVKGLFAITDSLYINVTQASIAASVIINSPPAAVTSESTSTYSASTKTVFPTSLGSLSTYAPLQPSGFRKRGSYKIPTSNFTPIDYTESPTEFQNAMFEAAVNTTPTHNVRTSFITTSGYISVNYLSHPPRTALSALVMSAGGGIDVSMNPAFVGPFAVRNVWGEIRLPTPDFRSDPTKDQDPFNSGRQRGMELGAIDVPPGSLFGLGGVNASNLPYSSTTITGAAYWYFNSTGTTNSTSGSGSNSNSTTPTSTPSNATIPGGNGTMNATFNVPPLTPLDIQRSNEALGSQLMVLGAWGDVKVSFDGT